VDETQQQLEWEARAGRLAALAAFVSSAAIIGGIAARASIGQSSDKKAESLRIAHDHAGAITAFSVLTAVSFVALVFALLFLYRATAFRREQTPAVTMYIVLLGPLLVAAGGIVASTQFLDTADQFVASGAQTEARAKDLIDNSVSPAVGGLGYAGAITLGLAVILLSLNAMRAGLLSRFMGILGIIFGALQVLPILPGPVIQMFWVTALGLLFLGFWPGGGRGPAWETGEAIEWPSAQSRFAPVADSDDDEGAVAETVEAAGPVSQRNPNSRSRKRKKKARH
jgi:hypothetical protein